MKMIDLFSGIGGFSLAASWVWGDQLEIVSFVEWDKFCQQVLRKNFPGVPIHDDIKTFSYHEPVDLITGGFPCQPFSAAGKRRGKDDDRYLWPEMLRVISEVRPRWIIGENVAGIINLALDKVCADLEDQGYEVQPVVIPACAVNAPHRRDRVWIVGYFTNSLDQGLQRMGGGGDTNGDRMEPCQSSGCEPRGTAPRCDEESIADTERLPIRPGLCPDEPGGVGRGRSGHGDGEDAADTGRPLLEIGSGPEGERPFSAVGGGSGMWDEDWYSVALRTCVRGVDDGIPSGLGRPKGWRVNALKALGNAIVPQVVVPIMEAIRKMDCKKIYH